jgi:hypothetical protein
LALKFHPAQPGKGNVFAPAILSAWQRTKFQGCGAWRGWWPSFEAGFEKDPHGPSTTGIDINLKNSPTPQLPLIIIERRK